MNAQFQYKKLIGYLLFFPLSAFAQESKSGERGTEKKHIEVAPLFQPQFTPSQVLIPMITDTLQSRELNLRLEKLDVKELIKMNAPKRLFPSNTSYAVRSAMLRYMATCKEADPNSEMRLKAIQNVESMVGASGARKVKKVNFNLDPVNAFYAYRRKQTAERTARIIGELNRFDEK